jgi:hypothetical protein
VKQNHLMTLTRFWFAAILAVVVVCEGAGDVESLGSHIEVSAEQGVLQLDVILLQKCASGETG